MDEGQKKIHDGFAGDNDFTDSTGLIESSLLELGEGGVSLPTAIKDNVLARKPSPFRRHSPLFRAARNQLTSFSGIVTCGRLYGLTSIKLVLS